MKIPTIVGGRPQLLNAAAVSRGLNEADELLLAGHARQRTRPPLYGEGRAVNHVCALLGGAVPKFVA